MSAALAQDTDHYASAANLFSTNMFDQPMTAAIRLGQWEWKHTVLNVDGIKETNFALHHVAPPNTNSTVYKQCQQGEIELVQQEQVEEDKSRFSTKTTDLYHHGQMGTVPEMHTLIGNCFAIMCVIIVYNPAHQLLVWLEFTKFDQVMRSPKGRQWSKRHHDAREVLFNVIHELQSIIAGFVTVARSSHYKKLLSEGATLSDKMFAQAERQSLHITTQFSNIVLLMVAGQYRESTLLYKVFSDQI